MKMLKYFIEHTHLDQVKSICLAINTTKRKLQNGDFVNPMKEFDESKSLFEEIK